MATTPPGYPPVPPPGAPMPAPTVNKTNPILWILLGIAGFFILVVVAVVGAGLFFAHKIQQNPGLVLSKIIETANPNVEVLSVDKDSQKIAVRDKKSGKTYSVNFEDAKKGKLVLQEDGKDSVVISSSGSGANGAVEIKSADGTVKIGAGGKVPAWLPDYPSSDPQGTFSANSKDGASGSFAFKTKDTPDKVTRFYEDAFKSSGMKIASTISTGAGSMMTGEDEAKAHTAIVMVGSEGGETSVSVTYTVKTP